MTTLHMRNLFILQLEGKGFQKGDRDEKLY